MWSLLMWGWPLWKWWSNVLATTLQCHLLSSWCHPLPQFSSCPHDHVVAANHASFHTIHQFYGIYSGYWKALKIKDDRTSIIHYTFVLLPGASIMKALPQLLKKPCVTNILWLFREANKDAIMKWRFKLEKNDGPKEVGDILNLWNLAMVCKPMLHFLYAWWLIGVAQANDIKHTLTNESMLGLSSMSALCPKQSLKAGMMFWETQLPLLPLFDGPSLLVVMYSQKVVLQELDFFLTEPVEGELGWLVYTRVRSTGVGRWVVWHGGKI